MDKLVELDGVGPKTSKLFEKLGIYNVYDLISFYPKRYNVLKRTDMNKVLDKDNVVIDGVIDCQPTVGSVSSNIKRIMFRIGDNRGIYNIVVFNKMYLLKELKYGMSVIIIGKYDRMRNIIVASDIRYGKLPNVPSIEPVYRATEGLNSNLIGKIIDKALNSDLNIIDYIPNYLVEKYHFLDKLCSIRELHHPVDIKDFKRAKQRLKYEELFWYLIRVRYLKYLNTCNINRSEKKIFDCSMVDKFIRELSFELTSDQIKTIKEIENDMLLDKQMNRLVQGDVGSGKTIVAFIAGYMNCLSGYQTAMMVPTEILANQHYQSAVSLFKNTDIEVALLTSNIPKRKRVDILKKLSTGEIDFVIGTQSLIQKDVFYKKLGLIITDEQHRFGVNQRKLLIDKGVVPDVLSMSATPIPRTYALTIYGDIDVSSIKTKPKGRKEVSTLIRNEKEIIEVLNLMKNEIDKGHQVYVVVPAVDGEESDLDNVNKLKDKMKLAFGKICKIGCVYGGLDVDKKNSVMKDFEDGNIKILISTTVIEVGVNVPNASMIVIFQANMFGLSTLHQLRGRVGRGSIDSYCILISKNDCERLNILAETFDGFKISEYDFINRGEGDLFGVRQSGQAEFKLADLQRDFELLVRVKEDVDYFYDNYFNFDVYRKYKEQLETDILSSRYY